MSTAAGDFIVEVLGKEHDRVASFDCGHSELNAYLRTQARQEMDRGSASVSVLVSVYVLVLPMKTIGTLTESSSSSSSRYRSEIRPVERRADVIGFIHDHVDSAEVYRLSEADLHRISS